MTTLIRTAAAALALAGFAALPLASLASDQPMTKSYATVLTPQHGVGGFDGVLTLNTYPGGVVNGLYRSIDGGRFVDVTGGRSGNKIWLDIPGRGEMHIDATVNGNDIVGSTFIGSQPYDFNATPTAPQL
jgi:hypothetical protein